MIPELGTVTMAQIWRPEDGRFLGYRFDRADERIEMTAEMLGADFIVRTGNEVAFRCMNGTLFYEIVSYDPNRAMYTLRAV
ncbi:hypothetical protein [Speluncibacter jeojiensis]|uniref:Uncharacterized protein n=1 Tax=Speluncibacter jeojiensis TaxID=2710754 RepID=A0A9X4LYK7_9ACTN|nr:hypothetical protein [Corynebacteriales bacterium D3-21]